MMQMFSGQMYSNSYLLPGFACKCKFLQFPYFRCNFSRYSNSERAQRSAIKTDEGASRYFSIAFRIKIILFAKHTRTANFYLARKKNEKRTPTPPHPCPVFSYVLSINWRMFFFFGSRNVIKAYKIFLRVSNYHWDVLYLSKHLRQMRRSNR